MFSQTPPSIAAQKKNKKKEGVTLPSYPKEFVSFCETILNERDMLKNIKESSAIHSELDNEFRAKNAWQHPQKDYGELYWDVRNADCRMLDVIGIRKRNYTLLIIDIPYGMNRSKKHDDTVAWKKEDLEPVVKKFKLLTTARFYRIIVMHSRQQWPDVEEVFGQELDGGIEACIWVKKNCFNTGGARLQSQWEPFTVGFGTSDGTGRSMMHYCFQPKENRSNVVERLTINAKTKSSLDDEVINEYQKPRKLLNWMVRHFSRKGDWVLDLCSGSGTGMLSALSFGRNVVGVEMDKRQAETIPSLILGLHKDLVGFHEYEKALRLYKEQKPEEEKIEMDRVDLDSVFLAEGNVEPSGEPVDLNPGVVRLGEDETPDMLVEGHTPAGASVPVHPVPGRPDSGGDNDREAEGNDGEPGRNDPEAATDDQDAAE